MNRNERPAPVEVVAPTSLPGAAAEDACNLGDKSGNARITALTPARQRVRLLDAADRVLRRMERDGWRYCTCSAANLEGWRNLAVVAHPVRTLVGVEAISRIVKAPSDDYRRLTFVQRRVDSLRHARGQRVRDTRGIFDPCMRPAR